MRYKIINPLQVKMKFRNPLVRQPAYYKQPSELKKQGYKYAVCHKTNNVCYRLHKVDCPNLIGKRNPVIPTYYKTIEEVEQDRGRGLKDKDFLYCQHCFKEGE